MNYENYKKLSTKQKELYDFEIQQEILGNVTETNGRVKLLECWKQKVIGATIVISVIIVPLFIWLIQTNLKHG